MNSTLALRHQLAERFRAVRARSQSLVDGLEIEDFVVQAVPEASPAKWHLAHATWFFETFLLKRFVDGYQGPFPMFEQVFNSYYNAVGPQFPRGERGLWSRPTVAETFAYRHVVDEAILNWWCQAPEHLVDEAAPIFELGLHHEQQHQELLLCDLKAMFALSPLQPIYRPRKSVAASSISANWRFVDEGLYEIGARNAFHFDNEAPRHRVWLDSFEIATRLTTCGEWLAFVDEGGYKRPELWLSAGWNWVEQNRIDAPLYWARDGANWQMFTLSGVRAVELDEPICHISHFEADAFARFCGARLPLESEWEIAAQSEGVAGNFVDEAHFHPTVPARDFEPFGNVWQWTRSSYEAYPGYRAASGALGEYNGKWMNGQYVLRGGSCASSRDHLRASYRNFFPSQMRWQFCGLRLARDV